MATAESLLATGGRLDPDDLARRYLAIGHIRGIGRATAHALSALQNGVPWWEAGQTENSGGNGAAMRAAPVGLVHALDPSPEGLIRDAVLSAVPTHSHPVGVAGAVTVAAGVAWCVRASLSGARRWVSASIYGWRETGSTWCPATAGCVGCRGLAPGGLLDRLGRLP